LFANLDAKNAINAVKENRYVPYFEYENIFELPTGSVGIYFKSTKSTVSSNIQINT